jgi:acetyl esterase/lipase
VAVLLHGGYWRARYDLAHLHGMAGDLCRRGYAVWNLEFRRIGSPGGGWPGTFADVRAGMAALAELAASGGPGPATAGPGCRLDLDRIVVFGHSAGGHLALWAAGSRRLPDLTDPSGVRPALVVSLAGVTDLVEAARRDLSDGAARELLGGGPTEVPDRYRLACPTLALPLRVPALVVHGDADTDVPFDLAGRYAAAARAAGDPVRLLLLPGVDHFALIDPATPAWVAVLAEVARQWPAMVPNRTTRTAPS